MQYPVRFERLARQNLALLLALGALVLVGAAHAINHQGSAREPLQPVKTATELLQMQWSYLPGATRIGNDLQIKDSDFRVVEQNGSGGQPNPPVNLYGTHLKVNGPFQVISEMTDIKGKATLQLYGNVPNIQDEFRVEPPSLQLNIDRQKGEIKANLWDGSIKPNLANPQPAIERIYKINLNEKARLNITRLFGKLAIGVNGKALGSLPEKDVFESGEVWFGASSNGGDYRLSSLVAKPINGSKISTVDTSTLKVQPNQEGLQQLANHRRPGFKVGAAMSLAPIVSDKQYAQLSLGGNFGILTTENALKRQFIEPQPGQFDFKEADSLFDLAKRHGMKVHGHALVFSEANPRWLSSLPTNTVNQKNHVKQIMVDGIEKVGKHYNLPEYKGVLTSIDVVNEPVADYDNFSSSGNGFYRQNIWYRAMGPEYIPLAFNTARKAFPGVKLTLNEFGLETYDERTIAVLKQVKKWKSEGVPIDVVGIQAHVYERGDKVNTNDLNRVINEFKKIGVEVRMSENDVYSDDGLKVQAEQYKAYFRTCFENPNCISYTTWGVSDKYDLWQDDNHQLQHGKDFLWDKNMKPTPALLSIKNFLKTGK